MKSWPLGWIMFAHYPDIFKKRGHLYHQAMVMFPQARMEEFHHVLRMSDIKEGDIICDVPSGGGYLRNYVDRSVALVHVETSKVFAQLCRSNDATQVLLGTLENIPLEKGSVDKIISLAALHHVAAKERFFSEAYRVLRKGGTITIADVKDQSAPYGFLDGFVHEHNTMGHQGQYIHCDTPKEIAQSGFKVVKSSLIGFHWKFDSLQAMGGFCHLLFGIDQANPDEVIEGIRKHLGYTVRDNTYRMNWELFFINARKP